MGHLAGKDIYQKLGSKIDGLGFRSPWTGTFHSILKELYSLQEADFVVRMPFGFSNFARISEITGYGEASLEKMLEGLSMKGLLLDINIGGEYLYAPSPIVVGIFEFTMMRTGEGVDSKKIGRLFHSYMHLEEDFIRTNFGNKEKSSILRTVPHEEAIRESDHLEVLDYEKAASIIGDAERFSIGICSCRHTMHHAGEKKCDIPLETCVSFGYAADYLIRHGFARESSKSEMLEHLARSRETGLVINADNVKRNVTFMCHCCGCCCHALLGISRFGYASSVVTSNFIACSEDHLCSGCGKCERACPINAIEMAKVEDPGSRRKRRPVIDTGFCLGCGVCTFRCETGALKLATRGKRVIHPETTFERIIIQCLERGTLQNQIFDKPDSITQSLMRAFVGAFLRLPPVKKSLLSDALRSRFLASMKNMARVKGNGWVTEI